jgi:hypothetical protein
MPFSPKHSAMARPMPRLAPVTIATLSLTLLKFIIFIKHPPFFIFRIHELDLQLLVAYPSLWCYNNTVAQELQSAVSGVSGV